MGAPTPVALPQPGDLLDGKYTILRVVGEGGMGIVYEATHVKLGQRVAIKMLQPDVASTAGVATRFEREARAAGRLRGRHVARVMDVEVSPEKLPYMVMEFLDGHDLDTELERRGPLPIDEAIDLVMQACKGIAEAHVAGIIHRDLKPSNLFLCNDGDERVVKLLDFGISKMADDASKLTSTELTLGTLLYMSPEQVRSAKDVDTRTDIWALGVIMHEVLSGGPPFVGSSPSVAAAIVTDDAPDLSVLRPEVPVALAAIVRKAMAKKPSERYPDVPAFAAAIAPYGMPLPPGSSARLLSIARPASSASLPRLEDELQNAKTMLDSSPRLPSQPGLPGAAVVAVTAPGWTTSTTSRARSRAPWLALGGVAVVMLLGATAFVGMRAVRATPGASAALPPARATTLATTTSAAASGDEPIPSAAPTSTSSSSAAAAVTPAPGPRATSRAGRPTAAPTTSAATTPLPASPAPRRKTEKAPLVAPF